jgi:hypothetical protein
MSNRMNPFTTGDGARTVSTCLAVGFGGGLGELMSFRNLILL